MNKPNETAETPYGRLDVAALNAAQGSFDTSKLLQMVDELDAVLVATREEDGLRDMLLRLHGMAHTVINGAGLSVPANEETLPELAFDVASEVVEIISTLRRWQPHLEVLERLASRN